MVLQEIDLSFSLEKGTKTSSTRTIGTSGTTQGGPKRKKTRYAQKWTSGGPLKGLPAFQI